MIRDPSPRGVEIGAPRPPRPTTCHAALRAQRFLVLVFLATAFAAAFLAVVFLAEAAALGARAGGVGSLSAARLLAVLAEALARGAFGGEGAAGGALADGAGAS